MRLRHLVTAATLTFVSVHAHAAEQAEPDDAARQEARELMARGRRQRETAELQGALMSFSKADQIMHVPTTSLEVAKTMSALGMLVEAAAVAESISSAPESADEPEAFAKARESAKELGRELEGRISVLHLSCVPAAGESTRITLDGKALDPRSVSDALRVNPGKHVAVATQAGATQRRAVEVGEGGSLDIVFDFTVAQDGAAPPSSGPAPRSAPTRTSTVAIYGLTGLAVAGAAGGIGLGLWSNSRKSHFEQSCAPHCSEKSVSQLKTTYVLANVSAAVGAASAIAAVTIYFARPNEPRSKQRDAGSSLSIAAYAGTEPGVSVSGSF